MTNRENGYYFVTWKGANGETCAVVKVEGGRIQGVPERGPVVKIGSGNETHPIHRGNWETFDIGDTEFRALKYGAYTESVGRKLRARAWADLVGTDEAEEVA